MTQHQNAYEIDQLNYITRRVSLQVVEENEDVLSPYFINDYNKIIRAADIFFSLAIFIIIGMKPCLSSWP